MEPYLSHIQGKTVLVTGGAGAIGSNLVRALAGAGARTVIVLDDLSASPIWNVPDLPNVLFVRGSVTDEIDLKRCFAEKPEIVFHLAAFFANQNSVDYPQKDLAVNGLGTLLTLQYSVMTGVQRFVFASSGCSIYGHAAPLPLKEDFVSLHLTTPYQVTKMLGELYANFFWHHFGLEVVKCRFFNSFGPGEVPGQYRNVIPNFIHRAMKGLPLPFTGEEIASRDFTYVSDLVDGLLRAAYYTAAVGQEMNLAGGREIRILDMAARVNELTGNTAGIVRGTPRKWDTKVRLLASIDRAKDLLEWAPRMDFDEGLKANIAWFEQNWERIEGAASYVPGSSAAVRGTVSRG
jgi:nucleoside-diphosphate-sugar epimerase